MRPRIWKDLLEEPPHVTLEPFVMDIRPDNHWEIVKFEEGKSPYSGKTFVKLYENGACKFAFEVKGCADGI